MQQFLDWLNNPIVKAVLLFIGGLILKRWDKFVNAAIPVALLVISIVLALLKALWPELVPASPVLVATSAGAPWWRSVLVGSLIPVFVAVGAYSGGKNTLRLLRGNRVTK